MTRARAVLSRQSLIDVVDINCRDMSYAMKLNASESAVNSIALDSYRFSEVPIDWECCVTCVLN